MPLASEAASCFHNTRFPGVEERGKGRRAGGDLAGCRLEDTLLAPWPGATSIKLLVLSGSQKFIKIGQEHRNLVS